MELLGLWSYSPFFHLLSSGNNTDPTDAMAEGGLSLRVFGGDALVAPGVQYKSVLVTPDMSSVEVRSTKTSTLVCVC